MQCGLYETVLIEVAYDGSAGCKFSRLCEHLAQRGVSIGKDLTTKAVWNIVLDEPNITIYDEEHNEVCCSSAMCPDSYIFVAKSELRIRILNLGLCPEVLESPERLKLFEAICRRRSEGYWQYQMSQDLNIDPKTVFLHLKVLFKYDLIVRYTLSLPRELRKNMNISSSCVVWAKTVFDITKVPGEVGQIIRNQAFQPFKDLILRALAPMENHIAMEQDLISLCFNNCIDETRLFASSLIGSKSVKRLYSKVRLELLRTGKVEAVTSVSAQNQKVQDCLRLVEPASVSDVQTTQSESVGSESRPVYLLSEVSLTKQIYDLVRASGAGIFANQIARYLGIDLKRVTKSLSEFEAKGMIMKRPQRVGKSFMYLYYTIQDDNATSLVVLADPPCSDSVEANTTAPQVKIEKKRNLETIIEAGRGKRLQTDQFCLRVEYVKQQMDAVGCATIPDICRGLGQKEGTKQGPDRKTVYRMMSEIMRCDEAIKQGVLAEKQAITYFFNERLISAHEAAKKVKENQEIRKAEGLKQYFAQTEEILKAEVPTLDIQVLPVPHVKSEKLFKFSQRVLGHNGFVFPMMIRLKIFHQALLSMTFSASVFSVREIIDSLTLHNYLRVVGCGYEVPFVQEFLKSDVENQAQPLRMMDLDSSVARHIYGRSSSSSSSMFEENTNRPEMIVRKMLSLLKGIKLVKVLDEIPKTGGEQPVCYEHEPQWIIEKEITLNEFKSQPDQADVPIGFFDLVADDGLSSFWTVFQSQVAKWIHIHRAKNVYGDSPAEKITLPINLQIPEVFAARNWKGCVSLTPNIRVELDRLGDELVAQFEDAGGHKLGREIFNPQSVEITRIATQLQIPSDTVIRYFLRRFQTSSAFGSNGLPIRQIRAIKYRCHLCTIAFSQKSTIASHYEKAHNSTLPPDSSLYQAFADDPAGAKCLPSSIRSTSDLSSLVTPELKQTLSVMKKHEEAWWINVFFVAEKLCAKGPIFCLDMPNGNRIPSEDDHIIWTVVAYLVNCNVSSCAKSLQYIADKLLSNPTNQKVFQQNRRKIPPVMNSPTACNFQGCRQETNTNFIMATALLRVILLTPWAFYKPEWAFEAQRELREPEIKALYAQWNGLGYVAPYKKASSKQRPNDGLTLFRRRFTLSRNTRLGLFGKLRDLRFYAEMLYIDSTQVWTLPKCESGKDQVVGIIPDGICGPFMACVFEKLLRGKILLRSEWEDDQKNGTKEKTKDSEIPLFVEETKHFDANNIVNDGGIEKHINELTAGDATLKCIKLIQKNNENDKLVSFLHNTFSAEPKTHPPPTTSKSFTSYKIIDLCFCGATQPVEPPDPWHFGFHFNSPSFDPCDSTTFPAFSMDPALPITDVSLNEQPYTDSAQQIVTAIFAYCLKKQNINISEITSKKIVTQCASLLYTIQLCKTTGLTFRDCRSNLVKSFKCSRTWADVILKVLEISQYIVRLPCGKEWRYVGFSACQTYCIPTRQLTSEKDLVSKPSYVPQAIWDIWGPSGVNRYRDINKSPLQKAISSSYLNDFPSTELGILLCQNQLPAASWVRLDGRLNCPFVGLLALRMWHLVRENPFCTIDEILPQLPLLASCEICFMFHALVCDEILTARPKIGSDETPMESHGGLEYFAASADKVLPLHKDMLLIGVE